MIKFFAYLHIDRIYSIMYCNFSSVSSTTRSAPSFWQSCLETFHMFVSSYARKQSELVLDKVYPEEMQSETERLYINRNDIL